jgi:[ribosomal protein S5]-alanine N-acetyltransferase
MIQTERLTLLPLTLEQLQLHVENSTRLEESLGLVPGHREVTEPLLSIITHFTIPRLKDPDLNPLFQTIWIGWDRETGQIVADAKFKGEPDEEGVVEIGYGTYPAFQRRGYMTEMVGGLMAWASEQPGVRRIMADTDADNLASQRVLQKNGFRFVEETEGLLWWERTVAFDSATVKLFAFDEAGYLQPYDIINADRRSVELAFVTNPVRVRIWNQFLAFQISLQKHHVFLREIWLAGSFISKKERPNDLDLVVFVETNHLNKNYLELDNLRIAYPLLHIFYAEYAFKDTELGKSINQIEKFKWFTLFSAKGGRPKGFVNLKLAA